MMIKFERSPKTHNPIILYLLSYQM